MASADNRKDLAIYRMEDAKKAVHSAKVLCEIEDFKGANNRAYYACYYAMAAILSLKKIAFRRHKDTVAYFNQHYVNAEIFPKEIGRKLHKLKEIREESDYDNFYMLSKKETEEQIMFAETFVSLTENYLKENQH